LLAGNLTLKARRAEEVRFKRLTIHSLRSSCRISVVITCYRFLQRLRLSVHNWCNQQASSGSYEVLAVNPGNPDGTHEFLGAVARSYPHVRVEELPVSANLAMNKGALINTAVRASRGDWIWLTDADCLFGSHSVELVLAALSRDGTGFYYGERRHLSIEQTDALLSGQLDSVAHFERVAASECLQGNDRAPWGYTQIVPRCVLEKSRYGERFNHFAHSDNIFAEECRRTGLPQRLIEGLFCLHLHHPSAWFGTETFL
jgi:glycosyltransferase involved in cell wall biosynthesis